MPKFHPQIPQAFKNPQNFVGIPGPVFGAIMKYLEARPYKEVQQIMTLLGEHSFQLKSFVEYLTEETEQKEKETPPKKVAKKKKATKKKKTKK